MATEYKSFKIQSLINRERTRIVTPEQWQALQGRSQQWVIVDRYEDDRTENAKAGEKSKDAPVTTNKIVKGAKGEVGEVEA